jgi:hypothetical protein
MDLVEHGVHLAMKDGFAEFALSLRPIRPAEHDEHAFGNVDDAAIIRPLAWGNAVFVAHQKSKCFAMMLYSISTTTPVVASTLAQIK